MSVPYDKWIQYIRVGGHDSSYFTDALINNPSHKIMTLGL
jgi:ligand-binding SRPBCC domain-containing protein